MLRYVPDEGIVSRLTQRWGAGGQGALPGGAGGGGGGGRRASGVAGGGGGGGGGPEACSLSVRRWDELVQEVTEEVRRMRML
jgi:hypothetical protein